MSKIFYSQLVGAYRERIRPFDLRAEKDLKNALSEAAYRVGGVDFFVLAKLLNGPVGEAGHYENLIGLTHAVHSLYMQVREGRYLGLERRLV